MNPKDIYYLNYHYHYYQLISEIEMSSAESDQTTLVIHKCLRVTRGLQTVSLRFCDSTRWG